MAKRTWLLITFVSSLFLVLGLAVITLALNLLGGLPAGGQTPPVSAPLPSASPQPSPTIPAPGSSTPGSVLSASVRDEMAAIESQVVVLRGLTPSRPVERRLLSQEELRRQVIDQLLDEYSLDQAQDEARLLSLLGLLPSGFDLWGLYVDLYTEQLAGYYDSRDEQLYLVRGQGFEGPERLAYAHEYVHALQDQRFDIETGLGLNDRSCDQDPDRCLAVRALLEGDATLLESQWLRTYADEDDLRQLQALYLTLESPIFFSAPEFIQQDFLFPYGYGTEFVRQLYLDGSWAEVDAAYGAPPLSSEQILHPSRYPDDIPVGLPPFDLAPLLGAGWHPLGQGVMGEWMTRLILAGYLPEETAQAAAEGWGGDTYQALEHPLSGWVLAWLIQWDTLRQAEEAFAALRDYGGARYGEYTPTGTFAVEWQTGDQFAALKRTSFQTLWLQAADPAIAEAILQTIEFPARLP